VKILSLSSGWPNGPEKLSFRHLLVIPEKTMSFSDFSLDVDTFEPYNAAVLERRWSKACLVFRRSNIGLRNWGEKGGEWAIEGFSNQSNGFNLVSKDHGKFV
jgi:hypothetical protein